MLFKTLSRSWSLFRLSRCQANVTHTAVLPRFYQTKPPRDESQSDSNESTSSKHAGENASTRINLNAPNYKPSWSHKRVLVLIGAYKTMDDVPDRISRAQVDKISGIRLIILNVSSGVLLAVMLFFTIAYSRRRYRKKEEIPTLTYSDPFERIRNKPPDKRMDILDRLPLMTPPWEPKPGSKPRKD